MPEKRKTPPSEASRAARRATQHDQEGHTPASSDGHQTRDARFTEKSDAVKSVGRQHHGDDQQVKPVNTCHSVQRVDTPSSSTTKSPLSTPETGSRSSTQTTDIQKNEAGIEKLNHDVPALRILTPWDILQTSTDHKINKEVDEYFRSIPDRYREGIMMVIDDFASHCLPNQPSWDRLSKETQAKLTSWAPNAELYMEGGQFLRKLLFVGWVWRVLYEYLFSAECTDKWSDEHWSNYGKLRSELGAHIAPGGSINEHAYHVWRFMSTYLLSIPHSSPNRLRRIIEAEFQTIIISPESQRVKQRVSDLVGAALRLDFVFESGEVAASLKLHDPDPEEEDKIWEWFCKGCLSVR